MGKDNNCMVFVCTKCGSLMLNMGYYDCTNCESRGKYIKTNLSFDDYFDMTPQERESYRLKILAQHGVVIGPEIKCPYCGSPNTDKIKATSRMFSVGLFGLGSSKAGKQWHCNKCGSNF